MNTYQSKSSLANSASLVQPDFTKASAHLPRWSPSFMESRWHVRFLEFLVSASSLSVLHLDSGLGTDPESTTESSICDYEEHSGELANEPIFATVQAQISPFSQKTRCFDSQQEQHGGLQRNTLWCARIQWMCPCFGSKVIRSQRSRASATRSSFIFTQHVGLNRYPGYMPGIYACFNKLLKWPTSLC